MASHNRHGLSALPLSQARWPSRAFVRESVARHAGQQRPRLWGITRGKAPLIVSWTSYGQKTRNRLDNRVYDLTTAHASACILSTLSCILHTHVRMEQMEGGRMHGLEDVTGVHHGFS
jgi:hypothetical protein